MKKLTAEKLLKFLLSVENSGQDLKKVVVNYRYDSDSDIEPCKIVFGDLYDAETNNKVTSICLSCKS